jgi:hypothetical protein
MNRSGSRILDFVGTAAALLLCLSCSSGPVNPKPIELPDLNGVWQINRPMVELLTADGKRPPLTAAALKTYEARIAVSKAGDTSWDNSMKCKPPGEPRTLFDKGWPFQIGQGTDRVTFMFQWNRYIRVIEMGAKLPDFAGPFFYGKSSGRWDGDTLVADVIGVREEVSLDSAGLPHSEDMKLTESFKLLNGGKQLEARIRVTDPATYTQPWEAVLVFNRMPDTFIVEDNCLDRLKLPNSYKPELGS